MNPDKGDLMLGDKQLKDEERGQIITNLHDLLMKRLLKRRKSKILNITFNS